jgi:hypothetical protein
VLLRYCLSSTADPQQAGPVPTRAVQVPQRSFRKLHAGIENCFVLGLEGGDDPLIADHRNFYTVEKWTKDGSSGDRMLVCRLQG